MLRHRWPSVPAKAETAELQAAIVSSLLLSVAVLVLVIVLDVKISLRRPSLGVACVRPGVRGRKSRPEHNGEYEYRCAEYEYEMPGETRNAMGLTSH